MSSSAEKLGPSMAVVPNSANPPIHLKVNQPIALMANNIHKTYRTGNVEVPVLRGVDVAIAEGEFVAIIGSSGSGKST